MCQKCAENPEVQKLLHEARADLDAALTAARRISRALENSDLPEPGALGSEIVSHFGYHRFYTKFLLVLAETQNWEAASQAAAKEVSGGPSLLSALKDSIRKAGLSADVAEVEGLGAVISIRPSDDSPHE